MVAPFVGAWIETYLLSSFFLWNMSHPLWVRGLKPSISAGNIGSVERSHPLWVRGLKQSNQEAEGIGRRSHPLWVRGLKHRN